MQDTTTTNSIKKFILKNIFLFKVFLTSLLAFLIVFSIGLGIIWNYRGEVFSYFAKEYAKEIQSQDKVALNEISVPIIDENGLLAPIVVEKPEPQNQESLVVSAVKKANPAVVSIVIYKEVPTYEIYNDPNQQDPFGGMFPGFFFNVPQYKQNGTEKKEVGGGSGFFVTSDGLIVTNRHVVEATDVEYTVFTNDGKKHTATVVARDPVLDIALIKVSGNNFPYLALGDSDTLEVGASVIAIGNALAEFRNTVSIGVISGLSRSITAGDNSGKTELLDHVIQTDAAINPGNSGGPLLDLYGRVVGVNVAVAQGSQSIGFALPINSVKGAIESVKKTGKIIRPYLGVRYIAVDSALKTKNNLSVDYGVLVKAGSTVSELAVLPGSPADKAGIVENDIILEVDGVKIDEDSNLASIIRQKKVGDRITLKVLSKGVQKSVSVTLEAAKDN